MLELENDVEIFERYAKFNLQSLDPKEYLIESQLKSIHE